MNHSLSLLDSEYRGCSQLLCDDVMLGLKSLRPIKPCTLEDGINVDIVHWSFTQHRDNAENQKN
jgi:hypothetical protein